MSCELLASQKNNSGILLDPRTKLAVLITIAVFILGGSYEGIMQYYIIVLAAIPLLLLSAARKWKGAVLYILIFGGSLCLEMFGLSRLSGVANYIAVAIGWHSAEVHPQRGHGIFRGNDNHGQRICCGDGTAPPAAADHHSYVRDVSLLSLGCGRMERYWGRHADAWRPLWWWKSRCDFRVSDCPHDDLLRQNRRGTVPGSPYAGIGRPGKTDEYL